MPCSLHDLIRLGVKYQTELNTAQVRYTELEKQHAHLGRKADVVVTIFDKMDTSRIMITFI